MNISPRQRLLALGVAVALAAAGATAARTDRLDQLSPREQALHTLNRLGFGPRAGDVERVARVGVAAYVDGQLHPERIPDGKVEAKIRSFDVLTLSNAALIARFEIPLREARQKIKAEKAALAEADVASASGDEVEKYRDLVPPENRPRRILEELSAARVLRAAESERQLNEVLVDFWMNHFNVYANKGLDRIFIASFERDTIRPRVWGKFEDLLQATAQSPAMLFYLDNARSVADPAHRPAGGRAGLAFAGMGRDEIAMAAAGIGRARPARAPEKAPRGLNENYARELMELHTLGVDGGYTQGDVTELARVLTGWTIARPEGEFVFRPRLHDVGEKTVLGVRFPAGGGFAEGQGAIHMLAHRPATARHIAFQLCQRLVADEPPPALVDRVAKTFLASDGDLRETYRAIVASPEFFDPRYYRAKVKSPFEYVVSAIRAVGGATDGKGAAREIARMGEPLYLCQPPTGYSDTAEAWVNAGALLARLNFALALTRGELPGTASDPAALTATPVSDASVETLALSLTGDRLSTPTRETIAGRISEGPGNAASAPFIAGLILGSPEFQKQ